MIECRGSPRWFEHEYTDRTTTGDIGSGAQDSQRVGSADDDQPFDIRPKLGKPGCIELSATSLATAFANPYYWFQINDAQAQEQREACCSSAVIGFSRVEFMQPGTSQPALQASVNSCDT